jgi:hypothetical protein
MEEKERTLPTYDILGTTFIVDIDKRELRELAHPENTISFKEMDYDTTHYYMDYDPVRKKMCDAFSEEFEELIIPQIKDLDPEGMALKYGRTLDEVKALNDIDILVNTKELKLRESGVQPVIEIVGHPFFVNLHFGLLQPKDDITTIGLSLDEIAYKGHEVGDCYWFWYDPKTHTQREPDLDTITALPKDLVIVEIPKEERLDPYAFARKYDIAKNVVMMHTPLQMNMKARIVDWDETLVKKIIAANLKKGLKGPTPKNEKPDQEQQVKKRRGRHL